MEEQKKLLRDRGITQLRDDSEQIVKYVNVYHDPWTDSYYTDSQVMYNTREAAMEAKNLQTLACSTMKYVDTLPVQIEMNDNELKQ